MWLLENDTYKRLAAAYDAGVKIADDVAADFSARMHGQDDNRILTIAGDQAEIRIEGVLTPAPDIFAYVFGGGNTTYQEIIDALARITADDDITEVTLAISSPGGAFNGLFETIDAINEMRKPVRAVVYGIAASAAYAIAAQANSITAANRAARIGSVGIVASFRVADDIIEITSSQAPKKRPDVRTEEGQAVVREELDAMHQLFVESIATGRNTSVDEINASYGQGATLLAPQALSRGMIDLIGASTLTVVGGDSSEQATTTRTGGDQPEADIMDLKTLMAQHPEAYQAAVDVGVKMERDRVAAHLTMGEASGAMTTAIKAVKEGADMTQSLQAEYLAAGMNRADIDKRGNDNPDTGDAGATAAGDDEQDLAAKAGLLVVSAVEEQLGLVEV